MFAYDMLWLSVYEVLKRFLPISGAVSFKRVPGETFVVAVVLSYRS